MGDFSLLEVVALVIRRDWCHHRGQQDAAGKAWGSVLTLMFCVMLHQSHRIILEKICKLGISVFLCSAEGMSQGQEEMRFLCGE